MSGPNTYERAVVKGLLSFVRTDYETPIRANTPMSFYLGLALNQVSGAMSPMFGREPTKPIIGTEVTVYRF